MKTALYRHYGATDELLYVGISANPLQRTGEHKQGADWFEQVSFISVEWFETREEAQRAEATAIRKERPACNRTHQFEGAVTELIEAVGHKVAIEELKCSSYANLTHFKMQGRFPAKKLRLVEAMCRKHGLPMPDDDLFTFEAAE